VFSQTVDYALRAVLCLATRPNQAQTAEQIARWAAVPAGYLAKVLQVLGKAGIVRSQRGLGGGFTLVKSPASLNVLDVVNAVDPIQRIECCPLGRSEHSIKLCPLHRRLDAALALIEDSFRSCTIADLIDESSDNAPLCPDNSSGESESNNES